MTKRNYDKAVDLIHQLITGITEKEKLDEGDKGKLEMLKAVALILPKLASLKKKPRTRRSSVDIKKEREFFDNFIERKIAERQAEKENGQRS